MNSFINTSFIIMVYNNKLTMSRFNNSKAIAEYIKTHPNSQWEKVKNAKPGMRRIDAVLIYYFFSNNRLFTPTSQTHSTIGTVDKRTKVIIDFLNIQSIPSDFPVDKLEFSKKGFAVFSYEAVLDELFEFTHLFDFDMTKEHGMDYRPANRSFFKSTEKKENFDDFSLEF